MTDETLIGAQEDQLLTNKIREMAADFVRMEMRERECLISNFIVANPTVPIEHIRLIQEAHPAGSVLRVESFIPSVLTSDRGIHVQMPDCPEPVIHDGCHFEIRDGLLLILGRHDIPVASYAPGQWLTCEDFGDDD